MTISSCTKGTRKLKNSEGNKIFQIMFSGTNAVKYDSPMYWSRRRSNPILLLHTPLHLWSVKGTIDSNGRKDKNRPSEADIQRQMDLLCWCSCWKITSCRISRSIRRQIAILGLSSTTANCESKKTSLFFRTLMCKAIYEHTCWLVSQRNLVSIKRDLSFMTCITEKFRQDQEIFVIHIKSSQAQKRFTFRG